MMFKNKCINCHFCCKAYRSLENGKEEPQPLSKLERIAIKNKEISFLVRSNDIYEYITCYRWKDKSMWPGDPPNGEVTKRLCKGMECDDFWPFESGYGKNLLAVEKKLENKQKSKKNSSAFWKKFFYTITVSIVTGILGVIGIMLKPWLINLLKHIYAFVITITKSIGNSFIS